MIYVCRRRVQAHLCGCFWRLLIDLVDCQLPADAALPSVNAECRQPYPSLMA